MDILIPVQSYGIARTLIPTAGQMTFSDVPGRDTVVITFTDQKVCVQVAKGELVRALRALAGTAQGDAVGRLARATGLDRVEVEKVIDDAIRPHAERIAREWQDAMEDDGR